MSIYNNFLQKLNKNIFHFIDEKINGKWRYIVVDFTNACNLRCPFCYNDWTIRDKKTLMDKETFGKVIDIFPLVNEDIYLSCNFEITLHPEFTELIKMIPTQYRKKCFFTTNLTKITDAQIEDLSNSGINYINISLDSLTPEVYERLRKGAQFDTFISNLNRLVEVFSKNPNAPSLRYSTLVFKQNELEIPAIIEKCKKSYLACDHEIRSSDQGCSNDWTRNNDISNSDWNTLLDKLDKQKHNFTLLRFNDAKVNFIFKIISRFQLHPHIYINSSGLATYKKKATNLSDISDTYNFFKRRS